MLFKRKTYLFFVLCFINIFHNKIFASQPSYVLKTGKFDTEQKYKEVLQNKALFSIGKTPHITIYTTLKVSALLSISNFLSSEKVPLTTDFSQFSLDNIVFSNNIQQDYPHWPEPIKRIIFLSLVWEEISRLNIFEINATEIAAKEKQVLSARPWQKLPNSALAQKIENLPKQDISSFVEIVLRVNAFTENRGGLQENASLYSVPLHWLMSKKTSNIDNISTIYIDESQKNK